MCEFSELESVISNFNQTFWMCSECLLRINITDWKRILKFYYLHCNKAICVSVQVLCSLCCSWASVSPWPQDCVQVSVVWRTICLKETFDFESHHFSQPGFDFFIMMLYGWNKPLEMRPATLKRFASLPFALATLDESAVILLWVCIQFGMQAW